MPINEDKLYPKYLIWLEEKDMTNGGREVSKISKSLFEEFKFRYLTNPKLKEKIDNHYKTIDREEKIDDIFDDDFELFLKELDLPKEPPPFHEDRFDF
jgi:hypothetical protein